ncbi:hypothetical protein GF386_04290 [Candidatus Pacearchaeota archaeon]|nr:hypothetical protein [Candidatus Pacearchaeota archaeon]MBD3283344.1 hypothetical protein [Candidatus Pacearchaeota archaeon]
MTPKHLLEEVRRLSMELIVPETSETDVPEPALPAGFRGNLSVDYNERTRACRKDSHPGSKFCNYERFGRDYRALEFCPDCGIHFYRPMTSEEIRNFEERAEGSRSDA